jgi:two-component system, response regulator
MTKTILLVEDNPSDEKLTIRAFTKSGVANEIVVARDGVEAITYVLSLEHELPALMLLDLNLPLLDGHEVLRRVRADPRARSLPVVILTASKEEEDISRSYALGANAYVRKPVEFGEFMDAAKTLGLFWLLLNEPPPKPRR